MDEEKFREEKPRRYVVEFSVRIEKKLYSSDKISFENWVMSIRELFGIHIPNLKNFSLETSKWKVYELTDGPVDKWVDE